MMSLRRYFVMLSVSISVTFAQVPQLRKPEAPTLKDTANYITTRLQHDTFYWRGTVVRHSEEDDTEISFDVMDIVSAGGADVSGQANQVKIYCRGGASCITVSAIGRLDEKDNSAIWTCKNAQVRDNVVRALNHFFRLLQQENMPMNDPFGPKH
jgi:hypothetical protein